MMRSRKRFGHETLTGKILTGVFAEVGRKYTPQATATPEWYLTSEWTLQQEQDFQKWLTGEIIKRFRIRKHRARYEAGRFLLFYGWKVAGESVSKRKSRRSELKAAQDEFCGFQIQNAFSIPPDSPTAVGYTN